MKNLKKVLFGVLFILGAVAIILESAGVFNIGFSVLDGILTIFLGLVFIEAVTKLHFFPMFMSVACVLVIFSSQLGLEKVTPWPILIAAALCGVGLSIIFERPKKFCHDREDRKFIEETINNENSVINIQTSFGAVTKYITNKDLSKIDLNVKFGAAKIYLDKATLLDNKCTINLNVSFSGLELYIPRDWKVINNVSASLGGIDEKNNHADKLSDNTLTLNGSTSFAGVEIIYI